MNRRDAEKRADERFCDELPVFFATMPGVTEENAIRPHHLQFSRQEDDRNLHANDRYLLVRAVSGVKQLEVNDRLLELRPGEALLLPPLSRHRFRAGTPAPKVLLAAFSATGETHRLTPVLNRVFTLRGPELCAVRRSMAHFLHWTEGRVNEGTEALHDFQTALELLADRMTHSPCKEERRTYSEYSDRTVIHMLEFIQNNLDRALTLVEVAAELHISVRSAQSLCRRHLKVSLGRYLRIQRLRHAEELLRSTDLPLKAVARETGYSSEVTLRRALRGETGVASREIRRRLRAGIART